MQSEVKYSKSDEELRTYRRDCWQPAKLAHFETREISGRIEVS